jgi:hypothetical protein
MIGPKMQQSYQYTWIFKKYANTFAKDKHMPLVKQGQPSGGKNPMIQTQSQSHRQLT